MFSLGRPRGRSVLSKPKRATVFADHDSSPKGQPRVTLRRIELINESKPNAQKINRQQKSIIFFGYFEIRWIPKLPSISFDVEPIFRELCAGSFAGTDAIWLSVLGLPHKQFESSKKQVFLHRRLRQLGYPTREPFVRTRTFGK